MVYLPPLLSTSQSPRLHTCLPPHLLYVKPSVSRSNCTAVTNAAGFFLYLRLAPTGTPLYCGSLPVVQIVFPCLVHRVWHSCRPCDPPLTRSYSQEYISQRYSLGHIHERRRRHGLVQRHVFVPRLRPFSCNETFHHGDRWPRPAETNRGGVLA